MKRIIVVTLTFLALLFVSIATITKPMFGLYEEYILKGHYVGETYAAYYFDFILYLITPLCFALSLLLVSYFYRRKNNKLKL